MLNYRLIPRYWGYRFIFLGVPQTFNQTYDIQALHQKLCDRPCMNIRCLFCKTQWKAQLKSLVSLKWNLWSWTLSPLLLTHTDGMRHGSALRNSMGTVKRHRNLTCTDKCTQATFLPGWGWGGGVASFRSYSLQTEKGPSTHTCSTVTKLFPKYECVVQMPPFKAGGSPIKIQWKIGTHVSWMPLNQKQWMWSCSRSNEDVAQMYCFQGLSETSF